MRKMLAFAVAIALAVGALVPCAFAADDGIRDAASYNAAVNRVWAAYMEDIEDRAYETDSGEITLDGVTMRLDAQILGTPDENGYPLYIALHGGGAEDDEACADEQWAVLRDGYNDYGIENGVYVTVRSLKARYDEHYLPRSFPFYDRIIENAVAFYGVDPNRVYLTGFSSGGDGVYAIAPRMADRFAAVNMSAGYPNIAQLRNLRNLPFYMQAGEYDLAFDRSILVAVYDDLLDALHDKYGGFEHAGFLHKKGMHCDPWADCFPGLEQPVVMDDALDDWLEDPFSPDYALADTAVVTLMSRHERDPYPKRVVWSTRECAGLRRSQAFYWLDRDALLDGVVVASYDPAGNAISIEECTSARGTLKLYLCPHMLDVFSDVTVRVPGAEYVVRPIVSEQIMDHTLRARGDPNYMFCAEIDVRFGKDGVTVRAADRAADEYTPTDPADLLTWDGDGIFNADASLFNISREELCARLGVGPDEISCDAGGAMQIEDDAGHAVVFRFEDGLVSMITGATSGAIDEAFELAVARKYGRLIEVGDYAGFFDVEHTSGGRLCSVAVEDAVIDGAPVILQKFTYYDPLR